MCLLLLCNGLPAQEAELRQAAERYKSVRTLTAQVTQTRHHAALTEDLVAKGQFYYCQPDRLSMVFKEAGEMLTATDGNFVMVRDGKRHVAPANGKGYNPFEAVSDVFRHLLTGDGKAPLTGRADVKTEKHADTCTLTITPTAPGSKARRRLLFTSCTVLIDLKAAELRSLRIDEPGGSYTQYDFCDFRADTEFGSSVFDTRTMMETEKP